MVLERKMWQCPVCETFYDTRYEAIWCCRGTEASHGAGKETAYICERCGEVFDSGWERDAADQKYVLGWLISSWKGLRDEDSLDTEMLATRLSCFKVALAEQIKEKELELDAEVLYTLIVKDIEKTRSERSALWLADARSKCVRCSELSAEQAMELYAWLHSGPAYLTDQDITNLDQLRYQLRTHLARKKMDWLLQEFSTLPKEQQMILFERLRLLVNS